jgi:hypothetical protein
MEETEPTIPAKKASPTKTILFAVLILLALALIAWGLHNIATSNDLGAPDTNPAKQQQTDSSPDPVKSDAGSSGDTNTSPSGTGPGSDNSIVGPP